MFGEREHVWPPRPLPLPEVGAMRCCSPKRPRRSPVQAAQMHQPENWNILKATQVHQTGVHAGGQGATPLGGPWAAATFPFLFFLGACVHVRVFVCVCCACVGGIRKYRNLRKPPLKTTATSAPRRVDPRNPRASSTAAGLHAVDTRKCWVCSASPSESHRDTLIGGSYLQAWWPDRLEDAEKGETVQVCQQVEDHWFGIGELPRFRHRGG